MNYSSKIEVKIWKIALKNWLRLIDRIFALRIFKVVSIKDLTDTFYQEVKCDIGDLNFKTNKFTVHSTNKSQANLLKRQHELRSLRDDVSPSVYPSVYNLSGRFFKITNGGFVVFRNKQILVESCNHEDIYFWRYFSKVILKLQLLIGNSKEVAHLFALEHPLDFNYWHLHAEIFPQLALVLQTHFLEYPNNRNKLTVTVRKDFPELYKKNLNELFGNYISFMVVGLRPISAKHIYLTSEMYERSLKDNESLLQFRNLIFWSALREFELPWISSCNNQVFDLIIVSRRLASSRRLLNEVELVKYLEGKGIHSQRVELEKMSWLEQLSYFNNTKGILAVHGAHSATLLFAPSVFYIEVVDLLRKRGLFPVMDVMDICFTKAVDHYIVDVSADWDNEDYLLKQNDFEQIFQICNLY
jgi:hypothetical protein